MMLHPAGTVDVPVVEFGGRCGPDVFDATLEMHRFVGQGRVEIHQHQVVLHIEYPA